MAICSLYGIPIFEALDFRGTTGNRVDFVGPPSSKSLLQRYLGDFEYEAIITGVELEPILRVRRSTVGESQLVGCSTSFGKGQIICMPPIDIQVEQAGYLTALADLPSLISAPSPTLPDWINSFRAGPELLSYNAIAVLKEEVRSREAQIAKEEVILAEFRKMKSLFAASGDEFKNAVSAALRELGLKCVDGPHPRADLLASNGVRAAAIEAKGLDGNAREANFRQVERWKAEVNSAQTLPEDERASDPDLRRYAEKLGFLGEFSDEPGNCKGLMVIGTFRNTLLDKRNLPDFPDNVARLLAQAGVCGLSGLQLCGLVLMARQDPTIKEKIVDTMYSTSGVLKMALNWREFLKETEQE
jgi:hypothetical protein